MPIRIYCSWRNHVIDGLQYKALDDFPQDRCVFISPRYAHFSYNGHALPYFQVHSSLRRYIWESLTGTTYPKGGVVRHHCLDHGLDSRGLCINPKHLNIGSYGDNMVDARKESKQREELNYWKPPQLEPLKPLPLVTRYDDAMRTERNDTILWRWSGKPTPLPDDEKKIYDYCNKLSLMSRRKIANQDIVWINQAKQLLYALKEDKDQQVKSLIKYFRHVYYTRTRQIPCAVHRHTCHDLWRTEEVSDIDEEEEEDDDSSD